MIELLDIDLQWRMHKVSDGQRRRVQICMGLLHPFKVLLLDEVTVDLDVVTRLDLLDFLREECEEVMTNSCFVETLALPTKIMINFCYTLLGFFKIYETPFGPRPSP